MPTTLKAIKNDAIEIRDLFTEIGHMDAIEPVWNRAYQQTDTKTLRKLRQLGDDALRGIVSRAKEDLNHE